MAKDKSSAKNVRDIKGAEKTPDKDPTIQIHPGNVSILTVKLLDAINRNIVVLIQQNAELIKLAKPEEDANG